MQWLRAYLFRSRWLPSNSSNNYSPLPHFSYSTSRISSLIFPPQIYESRTFFFHHSSSCWQTPVLYAQRGILKLEKNQSCGKLFSSVCSFIFPTKIHCRNFQIAQIYIKEWYKLIDIKKILKSKHFAIENKPSRLGGMSCRQSRI